MKIVFRDALRMSYKDNSSSPLSISLLFVFFFPLKGTVLNVLTYCNTWASHLTSAIFTCNAI